LTCPLGWPGYVESDPDHAPKENVMLLRAHGEDGKETMTVIGIGPHTALNIFVIDGNTEADRQTPMWGRGRIDHVGLQAASPEAFATIRQRLIEKGASDGTVNDFGAVHSIFFRDPDGLEGEVLIAKGST
jgi:catechol 2,3-dioxygenase-like lactoylglutathione lyase family enzyme